MTKKVGVACGLRDLECGSVDPRYFWVSRLPDAPRRACGLVCQFDPDGGMIA